MENNNENKVSVGKTIVGVLKKIFGYVVSFLKKINGKCDGFLASKLKITKKPIAWVLKGIAVTLALAILCSPALLLLCCDKGGGAHESYTDNTDEESGYESDSFYDYSDGMVNETHIIETTPVTEAVIDAEIVYNTQVRDNLGWGNTATINAAYIEGGRIVVSYTLDGEGDDTYESFGMDLVFFDKQNRMIGLDSLFAYHSDYAADKGNSYESSAYIPVGTAKVLINDNMGMLDPVIAENSGDSSIEVICPEICRDALYHDKQVRVNSYNINEDRIYFSYSVSGVSIDDNDDGFNTELVFFDSQGRILGIDTLALYIARMNGDSLADTFYTNSLIPEGTSKILVCDNMSNRESVVAADHGNSSIELVVPTSCVSDYNDGRVATITSYNVHEDFLYFEYFINRCADDDDDSFSTTIAYFDGAGRVIEIDSLSLYYPKVTKETVGLTLYDSIRIPEGAAKAVVCGGSESADPVIAQDVGDTSIEFVIPDVCYDSYENGNSVTINSYNVYEGRVYFAFTPNSCLSSGDSFQTEMNCYDASGVIIDTASLVMYMPCVDFNVIGLTFYDSESIPDGTTKIEIVSTPPAELEASGSVIDEIGPGWTFDEGGDAFEYCDLACDRAVLMSDDLIKTWSMTSDLSKISTYKGVQEDIGYIKGYLESARAIFAENDSVELTDYDYATALEYIDFLIGQCDAALAYTITEENIGEVGSVLNEAAPNLVYGTYDMMLISYDIVLMCAGIQ